MERNAQARSMWRVYAVTCEISHNHGVITAVTPQHAGTKSAKINNDGVLVPY